MQVKNMICTVRQMEANRAFDARSRAALSEFMRCLKKDYCYIKCPKYLTCDEDDLTKDCPMSVFPLLTEEDIGGIGLLSLEEYVKYEAGITTYIGSTGWWWLCTPGTDPVSVVCVDPGGYLDKEGFRIEDTGIFVRPVLRISSGLYRRGQWLSFGGKTWTMLNDEIALCDSFLCDMPFKLHGTSANYASSDIKAYLDSWLRERISENES